MKWHPLALSLLSATAAWADVDFNRDVRGILAGHCFECHGPDAEQRQAKLRLDQQEPAYEHVIVPGNPDASMLIQRLETQDPDDLMPPPEKKHPVTKAQVEILRAWIKEGAPYDKHWSFVPPERPALPEVSTTSWTRQGMDRFVMAQLDEAQLRPNQAASPRALIRRASLSVLGVPPKPGEVATFENDPSPNGYERALDRMMASPLYGERWARRWLDLARYADTNGYEKDRPRSIWPYRDWVIDALNADMPFDQFSIEQLAGDLLPNAKPSQKIATGFHRNTMINEEGGIDPLEYRFHSMVDRVGTTGTVWLGLTVACAQCHTHKFDPLEHTEYYQLMAYLNNAEEPEYTLPEPSNPELEAKIAAAETHLIEQIDDAKFAAWFATQRGQLGQWQSITPTSFKANLARLELLKDGSILASGDQTKRDVFELSFEGIPEGLTGIRLEALPHKSLPKSGPGRAYYEGPKGDFFLSEFKVSTGSNPIALTSANSSYGKLGIGGGAGTAAQAIDGNEVTGWSTSGAEGKPHQAVFEFAEPLTSTPSLQVTLEFNRHYPATLGHFRLAFTTDPKPGQASNLPTNLDGLLRKDFVSLFTQQRQQLALEYAHHADETKVARAAITALQRQRPKPVTTLIFAERPADHPRPTHRHHRGEFLQPKEAVAPALPKIFSTAPESPDDRLGYARWLVSESNPLVARVTVNRDWAAFFGRGLVATLGDFGYQGKPPSHPELLDWLATEWMAGGWSRKRLHYHLLTSATFRQSSKVTGDHRQRDPENLLLGRAPRVRIEAELVRDTTLQVAGLLTQRVGGRSVYPPQPASVTTEGTYGQLKWTVSKGEDRFRRGLYTFTKRTAPYAMFATFDAGSGEACLARREVTNTPLQALTALNDEVIMDAARALGIRLGKDDRGMEIKAKELFERILTRQPDTEELGWLCAFVKDQQERFANHPDQAKAFLDLESGDSLTETAAWAAAARALLNLDETFLQH